MTSSGNFSSVCAPLVVHFLHIKYDRHFDNFLLSLVVLNAFIAFTTVCSNLLVAWTIVTTRSLHSPAHFLLLGLSISDVLVGVFVQITYCVYKVFELQRKVAQFCSSGMVYISSSSVVGVVSFLFLTALTADRFLAVHLHLRYKEVVTTKLYGVAIGFIWLSSIIVGVSRVLALNQAAAVVMVILFVGLLGLNVYFHLNIFLVIRRHSRQIQSLNLGVSQQAVDMPKFIKSVNAIYYVIAAFLICYIPHFCTFAVHTFIQDGNTSMLRFIFSGTETMWMSNGVLNPIIYCWRIKAIRKAARRALNEIGCKLFRETGIEPGIGRLPP